jgi:hypothetical protein
MRPELVKVVHRRKQSKTDYRDQQGQGHQELPRQAMPHASRMQIDQKDSTLFCQISEYKCSVKDSAKESMCLR